jgi:hypothetical protein
MSIDYSPFQTPGLWQIYDTDGNFIWLEKTIRALPIDKRVTLHTSEVFCFV